MAEAKNGVDVAELKRRIQAALEFKHAVGDKGFRLRLPTAMDEQIVAVRWAGHQDRHALCVRDLTTMAVVGWGGITVGDVWPDDPEAARELPCNPETVSLLFELRLDLYDACADALFERRKQRRQALEDDAKNSASALPGNEAGPRRARPASTDSMESTG